VLCHFYKLCTYYQEDALLGLLDPTDGNGILGQYVGNCLQFHTVYHSHKDLNHQHCWENVRFHYIMFTVLVGWGSGHGYERFITSHMMCILHHSVYSQVTEHCIKPFSPLQHDDSFQRSVFYVFSMSVETTVLGMFLVTVYNVLGSLQAYKIHTMLKVILYFYTKSINISAIFLNG